MDPTIRLQKCVAPAALRIKTHHPRTPDVGTGILVSVPSCRAGAADFLEMDEYYGEYLGHGQSKTAFELVHVSPRARFHGKVLKISGANDMEPSVFRVASRIGLTTSILYDCVGVDADSGRHLHCWITDRTIPLDEFCRYDDTIKSRCSLAAFCCMLRAAQHKLYLSDCHFFNFGVRVTEDATEHLVVIIDAGSRGISSEPPWKKSRMNTTVMRKFWEHCANESAKDGELEDMWRYNTLEECLQKATKAWQSWPFLTRSQECISAIWKAMVQRDASRRSIAQTSSAFKIVEIVGRLTAEEEWNNASALVCYRAAKTTDELSVQEDQILDEFYERITYNRGEKELHNVVAFWGRLCEYRSRMLQSSEHQSMTPSQASEMIDRFKYYDLWHDLTWEQKQNKGWRSTLNTLLHKRAGWTHAAKAIMEYGLPKLEQPDDPDDATEHINALGQFVVNLAEWLKGFASRMHAYRQTEGYKKNYQTSMAALQKRRRRAAESD